MGRGRACSLFCLNTDGRAGAHPGTKSCVFTPAAIAATSMPNVKCERQTLAHSLLKEKVRKKKDNWVNPVGTSYKVFFCFLRDFLYPSISKAFLTWKFSNVR